MPRSEASVSGLSPGVFSHAVIPVKVGAGPQLTRPVALALQLGERAAPLPVSAASCWRTVPTLDVVLQGARVAGDVPLQAVEDVEADGEGHPDEDDAADLAEPARAGGAPGPAG